MVKRIAVAGFRGGLIAALVAVGGCSLVPKPNVPGPGGPDNPGPVQPSAEVAIFTVTVTPATATVHIGAKSWATRADGTVVEEFAPGAVLPVSASAEGYVTSEPIMVTMVAGVMKPEPIILQALPRPPPRTLPTITIVGAEFRANGKPWAPALVSALSILARPTIQQVAYLDWAAEEGFDGIRVFAGALTWTGQTADGARAALPALLDLAADRGLVVEVTALTDTATGYDAKAHLIGVADILTGRRGVLLELANEIYHGTQDQAVTNARNLRAWGQEIAEPRGLLWAIGAADTDEPCPPLEFSQPDSCKGYQVGEYPAGGGSYSTAHLDRGRDVWNNVRRVREIYAIADNSRRPAVNNEPMGADELDGSQTGRQRWNDPALFFAMGALERAFNVGGVHHSQAGLWVDLPGPVQRACAKAYLAGHRAVDEALSGQAGSYRNINHVGSPVVAANIDPGAGGLTRAYSFIVGNVGVTVAVGMGANPAIQWGNGWPAGVEVAGMTGQDGRRVAVLALKR